MRCTCRTASSPAVLFPQGGFFYLTGRVTRYFIEKESAWPFIAGQMLFAEGQNIVCGEGLTGVWVDYGYGYLSQSFVRDTDYGNVVDPGMTLDDVLNFYRIDILTASNHHVLLPVGQVDETVIVHPSDIAGV